MRFMSTAESRTESLSQFGHGQGTVRFENAALGVQPLGFNGIEPGTLDRQRTDEQTNALGAVFGVLVVLMKPLTHGLAELPGGVIPNQSQDTLAKRARLGT